MYKDLISLKIFITFLCYTVHVTRTVSSVHTGAH